MGRSELACPPVQCVIPGVVIYLSVDIEGMSGFVSALNEAENERLRGLVDADDMLVEPVDFKGPDAVIRGEGGDDVVRLACELIVRYSRIEKGTCRASRAGTECGRLESTGADDAVCRAARIGGQGG